MLVSDFIGVTSPGKRSLLRNYLWCGFWLVDRDGPSNGLVEQVWISNRIKLWRYLNGNRRVVGLQRNVCWNVLTRY